MSTTYEPNDRERVIRCGLSYDDGGFDANVFAAALLGDLHFALGLPEDPHVAKYGGGYHRAPYEATQSDAEAWAQKITAALHLFDDDDPGIELVIAWRDFLATCGGYTVQA